VNGTPFVPAANLGLSMSHKTSVRLHVPVIVIFCCSLVNYVDGVNSSLAAPAMLEGHRGNPAAVAWAFRLGSVLEQAPVRGPEHQRLEVFVGVWSFDGESKAIPALGMTDAGRVSYRHVNQLANGGFFLETRRTGTTPRGPLTELFVYSFNPASKTYRQDCYDSRGRVRAFIGTVDGLRWSFIGTNISADGQVTKERYTLTYSADLSSASVHSEHSKDEVVWYERLTGKYTKLSQSQSTP
jgi:hypothetical protein